MMGGMARLRNPIAQSRKFRDQLVIVDQTTRHPRPCPPGQIGECRKVVVKMIELETLPRRPFSTGRFIIRDQHNSLAGLARIATPENAEPIAF
jgi:hypothetical protein